jgi:hypothetical protein
MRAEVALVTAPPWGFALVAGAVNGAFAEAMLPWREPFFYRRIVGQNACRGGMYPLPTKLGWGMTFDPDHLAHAWRMSCGAPLFLFRIRIRIDHGAGFVFGRPDDHLLAGITKLVEIIARHVLKLREHHARF